MAAAGPDALIPTRDPARRRAERVMGTVVSLLMPAGGADSSAADRAFTWLHEVDRRFSPFRPDSEVSRLMRRHAGGSGGDAGWEADPEVSADLAEVLELGEAVRLLSDGVFDIRGHRADGAPDPTGLVKGWAIDRAGSILASCGVERFCLNGGGDVLVRGGRTTDLAWRIGVADPEDRHAVAIVLEGADLAVATSGVMERGTHIVDGRTGLPADELLSLTVVGPGLARADAYATAAFAMGLAGIRWVEALPGYAACAVTRDHRLVAGASIERHRAAVGRAASAPAHL